MGTEQIPYRKLDDAEACWLVESDGTLWRVLDVSFDDGMAWVRVRRPDEEANGGRPPVCETAVADGALLVWELSGGARVLARSGPAGRLRWNPDGENAAKVLEGIGLPA